MIREETDPENFLRRGTQITLYLRVCFYSQPFFRSFMVYLTAYSWLQEDDKYEFAESTRIKNLVKNYSQFVGFPIYTWQEKSRTVDVRIAFCAYDCN